MKALEQENRELRRANEILKRAASFFGAELDRAHKQLRSSTPTATTSSRAGAWGVELICRVLQVAPSSYYEVKNRQRSGYRRRR